MLRKAFEIGVREARARYKLATSTQGFTTPAAGAMNPSQTAAAAMPMAPAKPPVSPTAPLASAAPRSNVLG